MLCVNMGGSVIVLDRQSQASAGNAAAAAFDSFMDAAPETLEFTFKINTMSLLHLGQAVAAELDRQLVREHPQPQLERNDV